MNTPLIRTDFTDQESWDALCEAVETPSEDDFLAYVEYIDDPANSDLTPEQILERYSDPRKRPPLIIVADKLAMGTPEMPLLAIDVREEWGRQLRVIVTELWSIENNISISNMWFTEFVAGADPDGVFRGFPGA
jgi:hypothetical protein